MHAQIRQQDVLRLEIFKENTLACKASEKKQKKRKIAKIAIKQKSKILKASAERNLLDQCFSNGHPHYRIPRYPSHDKDRRTARSIWSNVFLS